jgi:hypothetical protein
MTVSIAIYFFIWISIIYIIVFSLSILTNFIDASIIQARLSDVLFHFSYFNSIT